MKKIRFLIATALTGASLALIFAPGLLSDFSQPLQRIESRGKLLVTSLFVLTGLYAVMAARTSGRKDSDFPIEEDPEEPSTKEGKLVGEEIEQMIEDKEKTEIRRRLERDAEEALKQSQGLSEKEAREKIREGEWTENKTVAAFLSTSQVFPVIERIKEWIQEDRTEERTRKTVNELQKTYYEK